MGNAAWLERREREGVLEAEQAALDATGGRLAGRPEEPHLETFLARLRAAGPGKEEQWELHVTSPRGGHGLGLCNTEAGIGAWAERFKRDYPEYEVVILSPPPGRFPWLVE